ncbi:MAG TPA: molybdate ABC transporter permease subunit [Myxococcota bacterium]
MSRALATAAAVVALAFFALPLLGILAHTPLVSFADLTAASVLEALALSLVTSLGAVVVAVVLGLPLAALIARTRGSLRTLLRALAALPLVLPPVVAGVGLLFALGRNGIFGPALALVDVELPFTTAGAVVAAAFVAAPYFVLAAESGFSSIDPILVDAAQSFGASRALIFRTVAWPALSPSLRAGVALCFARALGEFGATITFAGNREGKTQTLPLLVYETLHDSPERAAVLSLLLVAAGAAAFFGLRAWPTLPERRRA